MRRPRQPLPTRCSATSEVNRPLTSLIADGALDADLAALLWLLSERGVPLVVASSSASAAEGVRAAIAELVTGERRLADQQLAGRAIAGRSSLEEVLEIEAPGRADAISDRARDLGVVVIVDGGEPPARVTSAHYVRPVERDAHGHAQRRPPAILSAHETATGRLDHFWWAITDELATRARLEAEEFDAAHRRRARLLVDLTSARVFDRDELRAHVARAALDEGADATSRRDARH